MFAKSYICKQEDAELISYHSSAKTGGGKRDYLCKSYAAEFGGGMELKMVGHARRKSILNNINTIQLYILTLPALFLLFVFNYIPMLGIVIAFKDYRFDMGIIGSKWVGFENFKFFLKSDDMFRIVRNTIGLNALFIVTGLVVSVVLAILMFEIKKRIYVKVYQTVLIIPNFISWVVVGYMAYAFLNPAYGSANHILSALGFKTVAWYSKPEYWPTILTITSLWKGMGINLIIYYAALVGIDKSYFEAAEIDGANKWKVTLYITIPFLVPLMTILTILSIGNIFRADFGLFYQIPRDVGQLYSTTDVVDTYIYRVMRAIGDISMSSAVSVLQSVVGFVLVFITNLVVKRIEPENSLF